MIVVPRSQNPLGRPSTRELRFQNKDRTQYVQVEIYCLDSPPRCLSYRESTARVMIRFSISCRHIPWHEHRSEIMILISNRRSPFHSSCLAIEHPPYVPVGHWVCTLNHLFQRTMSVGWQDTYPNQCYV